MDFKKVIKTRRSVHHFVKGKKVTRAQLKKIFEAVRLTPSGYNAQPWEFVVVQSKPVLKKITEAAFGQKHIEEAGTAIVVLADTNIGRHGKKIVKDWVKYKHTTPQKAAAILESMQRERDYAKLQLMAIRNTALACMTLMYAATDLGLATCPMMGVNQKKLKQAVKVPKDYEIAMLIVVGVEDKKKTLKQLPRKKISEMIHQESF